MKKRGKRNLNKNSVRGIYLKNAIYGASDGIVTTFAIIAGVVGASLDVIVILILGFAKLLADAFSMAVANYLGQKSERDYNKYQRIVEEGKSDGLFRKEKNEIRKIYYKKGFRGELLDRVVNKIYNNKKTRVDTVLKEELNIVDNNVSPIKGAIATFIAFVLAGFMPLLVFVLAYFIPYFGEHSFVIAAIITALTFMIVGTLKSLITRTKWWRGALEMLLIGGTASALAYVIGIILASIV